MVGGACGYWLYCSSSWGYLIDWGCLNGSRNVGWLMRELRNTVSLLPLNLLWRACAVSRTCRFFLLDRGPHSWTSSWNADIWMCANTIRTGIAHELL